MGFRIFQMTANTQSATGKQHRDKVFHESKATTATVLNKHKKHNVEYFGGGVDDPKLGATGYSYTVHDQHSGKDHRKTYYFTAEETEQRELLQHARDRQTAIVGHQDMLLHQAREQEVEYQRSGRVWTLFNGQGGGDVFNVAPGEPTGFFLQPKYNASANPAWKRLMGGHRKHTLNEHDLIF